MCLPIWDKFWTKDTNRPNNSTVTLKSPEQRQGGQEQKQDIMCICPLHTTPPKGCANHLSHTLHTLPTLTPYKKQAQSTPHPLSHQASKGTCPVFLFPSAADRAPVKPCLKFFSGLSSISIDYGGQEL